jgi:hypothetical protein
MAARNRTSLHSTPPTTLPELAGMIRATAAIVTVTALLNVWTELELRIITARAGLLVKHL